MKYVFDTAIGRGWIEDQYGSIQCFLKDDDQQGIVELDPGTIDRDMFLETAREPEIITVTFEQEINKESVYAMLQRLHAESLFRGLFTRLIDRSMSARYAPMYKYYFLACESLIIREDLTEYAKTYIASSMKERDVVLNIPDAYPTLQRIVCDCT